MENVEVLDVVKEARTADNNEVPSSNQTPFLSSSASGVISSCNAQVTLISHTPSPELDEGTPSNSVKAVADVFEVCKLPSPSTFSSVMLDYFEKLFKQANAAQDGLLTDSELMSFLDQYDYVISKQKARHILREGDTNKVGALNFDEFLGLWTKVIANNSANKAHLLQLVKALSLENAPRGELAVNMRQLFKILIHSITKTRSVQEKVEYFENKITEHKLGKESSTCVPLIQSQILPRITTIHRKFDPDARSSDSDISLTTTHDFDFDLIVIGNGSGGFTVAHEAVKMGLKVAICDPQPLLVSSASCTALKTTPTVNSLSWRFGAACFQTGCVPRMLMHYAGQLGGRLAEEVVNPYGWFDVGARGNAGGGGSGSHIHDWTTLIDNIQTYTRTLCWERQFRLQAEKGMHYFACSKCEFDDPHKVLFTSEEDKSEECITAEKILISVTPTYKTLDVRGATGSCITMADLFSTRRHPGRVLIVGGGTDAVEAAGLLSALNVEVFLMSKSPLLRTFDRRMVTLILESLHSRGVKIMIGWCVVQIDQELDALLTKNVTANHVHTGEKMVRTFDTVVLAVGRKPSTLSLHLSKAGVLTEEFSSKIWVDSQGMTTVEDIYAIGECTSHWLTDDKDDNDNIHNTTLLRQAGLRLARHLCHNEDQPEETTTGMDLPKFLLTPVPYASIGLSEEAACKEYGDTDIKVYFAKFTPFCDHICRNSSQSRRDPFYAKMLTRPSENERIIGVHYLGQNAGEVIHGFALGMKLKATREDLKSIIGVHPCSAEIFTRMEESGEENSNVDIWSCTF